MLTIHLKIVIVLLLSETTDTIHLFILSPPHLTPPPPQQGEVPHVPLIENISYTRLSFMQNYLL